MTRVLRGRLASVSDGEHTSEFREWVRERTLVVAHEQLVAKGWDRVRVGEIAAEVGVSRPTLYAEFGNKEGIAEALVLAETDRFLLGIQQRLERNLADPQKAIRLATRYTFAEADKSALLRAILTASDEGNDTMLPLLTTRSEPIFYSATQFLIAWFAEHYPGINKAQLVDGVDALVRLVVSNLMFPGPRPRQTPNRVANVALALFGSQLSRTDV